MPLPWYEEDWSKGILLGLVPDPNTGYRAHIWFEYTRHLFNEIREGSLVAVRNFNDKPRSESGDLKRNRRPDYEEYSILQIDKVHPWHYGIQRNDKEYPGFAIAAAKSAREDWIEMDEENRDDIARIACEAIPLHLAFSLEDEEGALPEVFFDHSMPMPGFDVHLLSKEMMEKVLNQGVTPEESFEIGKHVVQEDVEIRIRRSELTRLHFGIFGYTGAGKSNLVSTLVHNLLHTTNESSLEHIYRVVLADLMDEYTGLLIDHLVEHRNSMLVVCGRKALTEQIYQAAICISEFHNNTGKITKKEAVDQAVEAGRDWSERLILPRELKKQHKLFKRPLARLIWDGKVRFYEPLELQGGKIPISVEKLLNDMGSKAYGDKDSTKSRKKEFGESLKRVLKEAEACEAEYRDEKIKEAMKLISEEQNLIESNKARTALQKALETLKSAIGSRGKLHPDVTITLDHVVNLLNSKEPFPALIIIIGEDEGLIANFLRGLIKRTFDMRRRCSILHPTVTFIFDEADIFIGQKRNEEGNMVEEATLIARRGRKFGLGLGIATQRIRYLNTSIMAQPHTYLISKLPRKTDRDAIAEAFAISNETLEQTFSFTVGQWLLVSHDATGLKGVPFPVQLPNANERVEEWLKKFDSKTKSSQ